MLTVQFTNADSYNKGATENRKSVFNHSGGGEGGENRFSVFSRYRQGEGD